MSLARSAEPEPSAPVRLFVPADVRYLRLARVTAAALAADLDFSVQDVDDVRVAVDELSAHLIEDASGGAELEISFTLEGGGLVAEGRVHGGPTDPTQLHPVAAELLALVVDDYELSADRARGRVFKFSKRPGGDKG